MHNITTYNLQLQYDNSNMFRSSSGHLQKGHSLKMRQSGSKRVKVEMFQM
jgi:hypothetical protein